MSEETKVEVENLTFGKAAAIFVLRAATGAGLDALMPAEADGN